LEWWVCVKKTIFFGVGFLLQPARVIGTGTFGCGSTIVEGEDFIAENITFENSAPEVMHWLFCEISLFSRFLIVLVSFLSLIHFDE